MPPILKLFNALSFHTTPHHTVNVLLLPSEGEVNSFEESADGPEHSDARPVGGIFRIFSGREGFREYCRGNEQNAQG